MHTSIKQYNTRTPSDMRNRQLKPDFETESPYPASCSQSRKCYTVNVLGATVTLEDPGSDPAMAYELAHKLIVEKQLNLETFKYAA
jgi:hypothetical protein